MLALSRKNILRMTCTSGMQILDEDILQMEFLQIPTHYFFMMIGVSH